MATAADYNRKTNDATAAGTKRRSPLLLTTLVAVIAAGVAGGGAWYYGKQQAPAARALKAAVHAATKQADSSVRARSVLAAAAVTAPRRLRVVQPASLASLPSNTEPAGPGS